MMLLVGELSKECLLICQEIDWFIFAIKSIAPSVSLIAQTRLRLGRIVR
jgi:hypothetical protein